MSPRSRSSRPTKWDAIIGLNLTAAFDTCRLAVPHMKAAGWGRIINTASAHSLAASPFKVAYVAAKHGIAGLTKTLALELATQRGDGQLHQPRLCLDAAGREPDSRHDEGAKHDPRAGDRRGAADQAADQEVRPGRGSGRAGACSSAAPKRRTSTVRTTRSMAGGRPSNIVAPTPSHLFSALLALVGECGYMGRHESFRTRQSGKYGHPDRPDFRRRIAASRAERHCPLANQHRHAPDPRDRADDPGHFLRHGHRHRSRHGDRDGAIGRDRRASPQSVAQAAGRRGAPGQALRKRHGGQPDHHRRPTRRWAKRAR